MRAGAVRMDPLGVLRLGDRTEQLTTRLLVDALEDAEVERIRATAALVGQEIAQQLMALMGLGSQ